jgi:hypothetical protein
MSLYSPSATSASRPLLKHVDSNTALATGGEIRAEGESVRATRKPMPRKPMPWFPKLVEALNRLAARRYLHRHPHFSTILSHLAHRVQSQFQYCRHVPGLTAQTPQS